MNQTGFGFDVGSGFGFGGQGGLNFDGPMFDDAAMRAQAERERRAREQAREERERKWREAEERARERARQERQQRDRHGFNGRSYVDPHEVLGVSPSASAKEIRAAWARLVKACHTDTATPDESKIRRINAAYERLKRGKR